MSNRVQAKRLVEQGKDQKPQVATTTPVRPFKAVARVQIPLGPHSAWQRGNRSSDDHERSDADTHAYHFLMKRDDGLVAIGSSCLFAHEGLPLKGR